MERKYLLPPTAPIFQVRDHVSWAAQGPLKEKYYSYFLKRQLSDQIENVYEDLEKLGYKILIWAEECETLYLRGNSRNLSKSQRDRILELVTKLASEGTNSSVTLEDDEGHFEKLWEYNGNPDDHNIPPVMENFQRYYSKSKVREYLRTNQYIVHGVDNLETLRSILASGLRPKTQISNAEGQGLDSGPYVLVYPTKAKRGGQEVDYRVGDYLGATVKGKPVLILFDVGELMDLPPIEVLEKRYEASHDKLMEYIRTQYPTVIGSDQKANWKLFGELGGFSNRTFKNLETQNRRASDDYFNAVDNPEYRAKDAADRVKELQEVVAPYKIPIKQIDFDSTLNDFVFVRYTP